MFNLCSGRLRAWCLGALISAPALPVLAADINPNTIETRLEVTNLTLQGFSSIDDYPLRISDLRGELNRLRDQFPEAMTVDELHQIADEMTLFVRAKGFVFHTVYLPPQRVVDGEVHLELQEGVLTDIHVLNKSEIPDRRIERVFKPLLGKLLYGPAIEERVKALKAQSGIAVFPFYSRAGSGGQTRLNLRVDPTSEHSLSLKLDNYGAATTGEYRLLGQWSIAQFSNRFDRLSLAVLAAVDDVPNYYGSIVYTRPSASLNYVWDISASNNQFELGDRFASLGLQGDATIISTGLTYVRAHAAERRERWRLGFSSKSNKLDSEEVAVDREDSEAFNLQWSKARQWPQARLLNQTTLTVAAGKFETNEENDDNFTKLELNTQLVKGLGSTGRGQSVITLTGSVQQADINLPSIEAFSLTGPYGVRGFEPSQFSADNAVLLSAEWRMPQLLRSEGAGWHLEPFVFVDWADGTRKAIGANPRSEAQFTGFGAGLLFHFGKHFSGQVYAADGVDGEIDGNTVYGDQLWRFELRLH